MVGTISWIVGVVVGVVALAVAFVFNARALKRDLDLRRETFRLKLEHEANAMLDNLFEPNDAERVRRK